MTTLDNVNRDGLMNIMNLALAIQQFQLLL